MSVYRGPGGNGIQIFIKFSRPQSSVYIQLKCLQSVSNDALKKHEISLKIRNILRDKKYFHASLNDLTEKNV